MTYRIDYLELPSSDGAASRDFFAKAFGWSFTNYGPTYDAVNDAGIDTGIQGDASDPSQPKAPLPIVRTNDLEQAERDVVAAGGVITLPPFDFPGGRRFHFREPGGNEMAVWIAKE
jgi:predicted enzyme related to lactoylglutathione lyase